ncbi:MAG: hypothetical protein H0X13_20430 [Ramlibacter sp.]|nr:hypothetical protein [Ramlibacter sp.]
MIWTDLGMRALDTALSSSQNLGEGVDRLARAAASTSPDALAPADPGREKTAFDPGAGLALAAQMQRISIQLMTQAWQQWLHTMGTLASLGAGRGFSQTVARDKAAEHAVAAETKPHGSRSSARARPKTRSRSK